jgi:hypothetical protein
MRDRTPFFGTASKPTLKFGVAGFQRGFTMGISLGTPSENWEDLRTLIDNMQCP